MSAQKSSRSTGAAAPGLVYIVGGKVEGPSGKHYRIKIGSLTDESALRQAVSDAYRKVYVNPEGLRPIIPPQHLVDTTFALRVTVPDCKLAEFLLFQRLRKLGAADQGAEVFTDGPEEDNGATVGLLSKAAMRKLLEQTSTATWAFEDKPGSAPQLFTTLPPGWPARNRASLG